MQMGGRSCKPEKLPENIVTNSRTIKLFGLYSCFPNNFRFFVIEELLNFDNSRFVKNGFPASQGGFSGALPNGSQP